eukprot:m.27076 g.27076  ORF g.27076 m.27076 type:complete len:69 (+) comp29749_c0_seq1:344-550(+)
MLKQTLSSISGGSWEIAIGPDVKTGSSGYEYASITVYGAPSEETFSVFVKSESPPFNVTVAVAIFLKE